MNQIDFKSVIDFFNLVYVPSHCVEIRLFSARVDFKTHRIVRSDQEFTVAGWFTNEDEIQAELSRIDQVSCYMSVNPVPLSNRPHHAKNNLKVLRKGEFVTDAHIRVIRNLIIDCDPIRLQGHSKINSTNQELFECINVRDTVIKEVGLENHCIYGISGNGAFILVSLPDYENNDATISKLSRFVNHLSEKYSNKYCVIDTNSKNASRVLPLPGSIKYRDVASTAERPHRRVEIQGCCHHDQTTAFRP